MRKISEEQYHAINELISTLDWLYEQKYGEGFIFYHADDLLNIHILKICQQSLRKDEWAKKIEECEHDWFLGVDFPSKTKLVGITVVRCRNCNIVKYH